MISSTTGNILEPKDYHIGFSAVIESAIEQILLQPITWDPVLATLDAKLQTIQDKAALRVVPIATTVDQLIYTGLQQRNPSISLPDRISGGNVNGGYTSAASNLPPSGGKIAIIGMAGRFPEAATTEALWDILRLGLDVRKEVPPLRWNMKTHIDPSGRKRNSSQTSFGCWLNDPDVLDADFFNISIQEATRMDPAQRLSLMTTYEAIEQAGVVWPSSLDETGASAFTRLDRVGVYYGVSGNDWRDCNAAQKVDSHFMRASNRAFISGRISEAFKHGGPSLTVDTSSSNSLAPVHIACRSLQSQETDMCIVGGAHVITNPDVHAGLDRAGFLSRSGNCKVFDETADGICRGEGVVSLVLKRLEDALAENDTVLGVIAGVTSSYTSNSPDGALFTGVFNSSNVDPASITYVEMGGPSTNVGDASQVASAVEVLAPMSALGSVGKRGALPLYLGSAMANIGHGEATSGLSSIIKVLLMFRENIIPPHIGIRTRVNSKLPVGLASEHNTRIHTGKAISWDAGAETTSRGEPRRALVHDLGTISRATSALLLEESQLHHHEGHECAVAGDSNLKSTPVTSHIITISAKSRSSLRRNLANLYLWLNNEATRGHFTLAQLSYTTTARRNHYWYRTLVVASSVEDLCGQLSTELIRLRTEQDSTPTDIKSSGNTGQANTAHSFVFAFTGFPTCDFTSSPIATYFRQLYESFSRVRKDTHHLEQLLKRLGLPSVMNALGLENETEPGQHETRHAYNDTNMQWAAEQLAHLCTQMVLSRLWRFWGVRPVATITKGGVDFYAALNIAGVLSDADAIYLAGAFIQLELRQQAEEEITESREHSIAAIAAGIERVHSLTTYHKPQIPILRLNTDHVGYPRLDIIAGAGQDSQVSLTRQFLSIIKPKHVESKVAGAPDKGDLVAACRKSNDIPDQSVIHQMGPETPTLCGLAADETNASFADGICADRDGEEPKFEMWSHLTTALGKLYYAGADIHWDNYHRDLPPSNRRVISTLPAYSWDLKEYWVPYLNDWTLFKGDASKSIAVPKLESTTIHTIIEETELMEEDGNKLRLVVESDISRHDLHGIVQGHVVDGVPLCTPVCCSPYSDCERCSFIRQWLTSKTQ